MAGLFIVFVILFAIALFASATKAGKNGSAVGALVGLIAGSSAGVAHGGDASSASLLFAAIGAIIGRLISNSLSGDTQSEQIGRRRVDHSARSPSRRKKREPPEADVAEQTYKRPEGPDLEFCREALKLAMEVSPSHRIGPAITGISA